MSDGIGTHSLGTITYGKLSNDWVRFRCTAGLASTDHGGKVRFYVSELPVEKFAGQGKQAIPEGPHATPNSSSILPHIARQALVALDAGQACVDAIGTPNQSGALMALRYMHSTETVDALIKSFGDVDEPDLRQRIARSLVRLVNLSLIHI